MSELDLLNLARSTTEHQVTINFGMVVAIYYFLHGAKLALKMFTFFAYTVGMMVLLGEMLVEANIKVGVIEALHALRPNICHDRSYAFFPFTTPGSRSSHGSRSIFLSGCFGSRCVTCSFSENEIRSSSIPDNIHRRIHSLFFPKLRSSAPGSSLTTRPRSETALALLFVCCGFRLVPK